MSQSQTKTTYGDHISCTTGTKYGNCVHDPLNTIPTK
jgi:hypothetical protein